MKYSHDECVDKFKSFLQTFHSSNTTDPSKPKYYKLIDDMISDGRQSLCVDFDDILEADPDLAEQYLTAPREIEFAPHKALKEVVTEQCNPTHEKEYFFRTYNLPKTNQISIRNLRTEDIGKLVQLNAMAMIVSDPLSEIKDAVFSCERCGEFITINQDTDEFKKPIKCTSPACGRSGPFKLMGRPYSKFIDHQKIEAIERREDLTGTAMPRRLPLVLSYDLVDTIKPGQRIIAVGVVREVQQVSKIAKGKSTLFSRYMEVYYITPTDEDIENIMPTEEEEQKIKAMAEEPDFIEKYLVKSFGPAIEGNDMVKYAMLLGLAGCDSVQIGSTKYRGDSHILLVGDPGTAKSQLTEFAVNIIPGAIFTTGTGVSGAGLTAVATQVTDGRWEIQAGALPMAHRRVIGVDEFEKMDEDDRRSIHTVMERGLVPIAKAGIVTSLLAECPIFANANPKDGRFNQYKPFPEQIDLPPTIISRFDIIFQVIDKEDQAKDKRIARHILNTWTYGVEYLNRDGEILSEEFLGKYIFYVKKHYHPKLPEKIMDVVEAKYLEMRKKANGGAIIITARQLQALIRLLCQHARLRQSNTVNEYDVEKVFKLWENSMESARDPETGEIDVDMIMTGRPKSQRDKITILREIIEKLDRKNNNNGAVITEVYDEAKMEDIAGDFAQRIIQEWKDKGDAYEPKMGMTLKMTLGGN